MKTAIILATLLALSACSSVVVDRVEPDRISFSNVKGTQYHYEQFIGIASNHCARQGKVAEYTPDNVPDGRTVVFCR